MRIISGKGKLLLYKINLHHHYKVVVNDNVFFFYFHEGEYTTADIYNDSYISKLTNFLQSQKIPFEKSHYDTKVIIKKDKVLILNNDN